jgi:hypothetical protein
VPLILDKKAKYREENDGFRYSKCPFRAIRNVGVFTWKCGRTSSAPLELSFRIAIYALPHCCLCSSAPLKKVDSTLRVMLQQIGENARSIKGLIISNLIKSPNFAIFGSGGRLFQFKGSICVKKIACFLHFCPKVPLIDKNHEQIYCSK